LLCNQHESSGLDFAKHAAKMFTRSSPCRCTHIATSIVAQGVQNIDWIPKTDPEPTGPFDIVQPVLQSPADSGDDWSVKSWLVTLDVRDVRLR
jgi:hypothetical protein